MNPACDWCDRTLAPDEPTSGRNSDTVCQPCIDVWSELA